MEKEHLLIDINAHITNVSCQVVTEDKKATANISFYNLGYGTITALKFTAKGYNSFGDIVSISGNETFLLIIQDVNIDKNSTANNIKALLPSDEIRKLELEEKQICFADGTIATYCGKKEVEFEVDKFSSEKNEEVELDALRDVFDSLVTYNLLETENGWICSCGRYNSSDAERCSLCGHSLEDVKTNLSEEGRIIAVEKKSELDEQRRIEAEKKAKEKKTAEKKKKIKIAIVSVVSALFIVLVGGKIIIDAITVANRKTYQSIEAMREDLQGTYTHINDVNRHIVISGNKLYYNENIQLYSANYSDIKKWDPHYGTFETYEEWVVSSSGSIENDGDIFIKEGYNPLFGGAAPSETAYSALKLSDISLTTNSSYTICTGRITNKGKKTYRFVKVKCAFKNSSKSTIDTDWTYAVGSEGLAPGESKTFEMSVRKDSAISNCSVSIYDYD